MNRFVVLSTWLVAVALTACAERPHLAFDVLEADASPRDAGADAADAADDADTDAEPLDAEGFDAANDDADIFDAMLVEPDADSFDATLPLPDAALPDAMLPLPDAMTPAPDAGNPCMPNPCGVGTCTPLPVTMARFDYECDCPSGYVSNGATCVDIDECDDGSLTCDALTECVNTEGSAHCTDCPSGYTGTGETSCDDIDECKLGTDTCSRNEHCANEPGSYGCYGAVSIHTRSSISCSLFENGDVKCWGRNQFQGLGYGDTLARPFPSSVALPLGEPKATAFDVGAQFSCALLTDGSVKCWGDNFVGQLGQGPTAFLTPPPTSIDLGAGHTARVLRVGEGHVCVIRDDNALFCWGNNDNGQLGIGSTTGANRPPATPVNLGAGRSAVDVWLGGNHTCALLDNDTVKCWGWNFYGELGYGDTTARNAPSDDVIDLDGHVPTSMALAHQHTCALLDDASLRCWGRNAYGELGYGDTVERRAPPATTVDFGAGRTAAKVVAAGTSTCAILDDGSARCWGDNSNESGLLGTGHMTDLHAPSPNPIDVGAGRTVVDIDIYATLTCALLDDGSATCWGRNEDGALGVGLSIVRATTPLEEAIDFGGQSPIEIVGGSQHVCALLENREVRCWGLNDDGQLGVGDILLRSTPSATAVEFTGGRFAVTLDATDNQTCATLDDGAVACWGWNLFGQIGLGHKVSQLTPQEPELGTTADAIDVQCGWGHTCALFDDGTIKCWGYNGNGQLGLGNTTNQLTPTTIANLDGADAVEITTGGYHSCAIVDDGDVRCWGLNGEGQLGLGDTTQRSTGVLSLDLGGRKATKIAAGSLHTCALLNDASVACWGANYNGQLGVGDNMRRSTPTLVTLPSGRIAVDVNIHAESTCVRFDDGSLMCWGDNGNGQLGTGDTSSRVAPIDVELDGRTTTLLGGFGAGTCATFADESTRCWGSNNLGELGIGSPHVVASPPATAIDLRGRGR